LYRFDALNFFDTGQCSKNKYSSQVFIGVRRFITCKSSEGFLGQTTDNLSKMDQIRDFVGKSSGLALKLEDVILEIFQRADGKTMAFDVSELDEVISRVDAEGKAFLQVNFLSGKKILLTDNLIGFKPLPSIGLDMTKLPKVVTTPDLISVVDAIEDTLLTGVSATEEVDILKKVFDSVLRGAEAVGFDLTSERVWLTNLSRNERASA
jgi:hypothetical protein